MIYDRHQNILERDVWFASVFFSCCEDEPAADDDDEEGLYPSLSSRPENHLISCYRY